MADQAMWQVEVQYRHNNEWAEPDTFNNVIEVKTDYDWVIIRYLTSARIHGTSEIAERWYPRDVVQHLEKRPPA